MTHPDGQRDPKDAAKFRRTLARVMLMQVIALALLWWLQVTFTR